MKKIYFFPVLVIAFLAMNTAVTQNIIAGSHSGNDTYDDFVPDSLLQAMNSHLSPYPGETMRIDMDHDGMNDFRVSTFGGGSLNGGTGGCIIFSLTGFASVVAHLDTSQGCCPSQYIDYLADTLVSGDLISSAMEFDSSYAYLWSTSYGWSMAPIINEWNNIGEHFIGVSLRYPYDTLYGWIRVEAIMSGGLFTLAVKDYACNKNTHIGIPSIQAFSGLTIYPNPFINELQINTGNQEACEIRFFDLYSKTVLFQKFRGSAILKTPALAKGIYFFELRSDNRVIRTGKLFKNE